MSFDVFAELLAAKQEERLESLLEEALQHHIAYADYYMTFGSQPFVFFDHIMDNPSHNKTPHTQMMGNILDHGTIYKIGPDGEEYLPAFMGLGADVNEAADAKQRGEHQPYPYLLKVHKKHLEACFKLASSDL